MRVALGVGRSLSWVALVGILGLSAVPAWAQPGQPARQRALLIAVQKYDNPQLSLAVTLQDSNVLKSTLMERAGMPEGNLTLLNDEAPPEFRPTLVNVRRELRDFLDQAEPADRLLIYFSGHGFIHEGQTYLVPADFDVKDHARTGLPASEVREALTRCRAAVKFLILDCCQAGGEKSLPEATVVESELVAKGLELQRVPGCVVLASCQAQEKSYEWPERRQSVFSYWFCRGLEGGADKDANGRISADEIYEYTYERVTRTVSQMMQGRTQTPVRQVGVGVVGVNDVLALAPESPESLCSRLAAHLDLEIRLRKLKKVGVLEFLEPFGKVEGLARSSLPSYCAEKVRAELSRLAGSGYGVLDGPQLRSLVRGMAIGDVGDPRAMQRLTSSEGDLDAVISGTLRRRGSAMALACEMIATRTGDTLASPSGKIPLSETLVADDGLSFDNRQRADGSPFEAQVVDAVLDRARAQNPLLKGDFPYRIEVYTILPAPGEAIGPTTRRVRKPFLQEGTDPNAIWIAARAGERFEVRISNDTDRTVGCALLIDGLNTYGQRRRRVEDAEPWVIKPRTTNAVKEWFRPRDDVPAGARGATVEGTFGQFMFTDVAKSEAGRQKFGDAIGTITAAFFEEDGSGSTRGALGVGTAEVHGGTIATTRFVPGRLLGAITIKYGDGSDVRGAAAAPR